jgi:hypothetical protein
VLTHQASKLKNVRWYNEKTKEFTWDDPKLRAHWKPITGEDGKTYYFNIVTGQSQWEKPDELAWTKVRCLRPFGRHTPVLQLELTLVSLHSA